MAGPKHVVWAPTAWDDLREILNYWRKRTRSIVYPRKLRNELMIRAKLLSDNSEQGKESERFPPFRYVVHGAYAMYYRDLPEDIVIVHIWDQRRDPSKHPLEREWSKRNK